MEMLLLYLATIGGLNIQTRLIGRALDRCMFSIGPPLDCDIKVPVGLHYNC